MLRTSTASYFETPYPKERDLEDAIAKLTEELFGNERIYLEVKRRIGAPGKKQNIPDAYLIDLSGETPRLYVVEVELTRHAHLRHIAVQLLEFSLAFESAPGRVGQVLLEAISADSEATAKCQAYCAAHSSFRNLDHLVNRLVDAPFAAMVIIDVLEDDLARVLDEKLGFPVDVLEIKQYADSRGELAYSFEPFLADLAAQRAAESTSSLPSLDVAEMDTIVVPARTDGFDEVFLGEDRWYAVTVSASMRPRIKFCAVYRTEPESAITHVAPVQSIQPWRDTGKVVINFDSPAQEIGPIPFPPGKPQKAPQNIRYTTRARLEAAKTLDDLW